MKSVSVTSPAVQLCSWAILVLEVCLFITNPQMQIILHSPTAGTYTYLVKFNDGEEITYTNSLSSSTLEPAIITSLAKQQLETLFILHGMQLRIYMVTSLRLWEYNSDILFWPFSDSANKPSLRLGFYVPNLTANGTGTFTFYVMDYCTKLLIT